jgi:hypothetical protein
LLRSLSTGTTNDCDLNLYLVKTMKLYLFLLSITLAAQGVIDTGPRKIAGYTVAGLPSAASYSGFELDVTDALTAGSCTVGGGSAISKCRSNGSAWISLGGAAGGATSISGLTDLQVTRTSSTVLNIAAGSARIGSVVVAFSAATATLSGASASSTAYAYVDSTGTIIVGHNGATTVTCSGCTTVTGVTSFPVTSLPIATATYTSAAWDVSGITDKRPILSRGIDAAGTGISLTVDAAGVQTITNTVAGSTVGKGTFASRPSCTAGATQLYNSTNDPGLTSICDGSSWTDYYYGIPITRPPVASSFTVVNGGTLADAGGTITLNKAVTGLGVALLALPDTAASWDIKMAFNPSAMPGLTGTSNECGLWITNGVTAGTHNAHGIVIGGLNTSTPLYLRRSYTPINGSIVNEGLTASAAFMGRPTWLRLTRSAGNVTAYAGDGEMWVILQVDAPGFTATHYGFGCDPRASSEATARLISLSVQ